MKTLPLLFFLISLSGCADREELKYNNFLKSHPDLKGVSTANPCVDLALKGWKVKDLECLKHIERPKYKIGQIVKVKTNKYYGKCVFKVMYPYWNGVLNEPSYEGKLICNGEVVDPYCNLRRNGKLLSEYSKETK